MRFLRALVPNNRGHPADWLPSNHKPERAAWPIDHGGTPELELATARAAERSQLLEEPSQAQLAVLRCLAAGRSRREVGERLYVSLNTVTSHTRELYRKSPG